MKDNARLAIIVAGIVLAVLAVWFLFPRGQDAETGGADAPAQLVPRPDADAARGSLPTRARPVPSSSPSPPASTRDPSARSAPQAFAGLIRGTVRRKADDAPVSGAQVVAGLGGRRIGELPEPGAARWEATSDASGRFRIEGLPVGEGARGSNVFNVLASAGDESGAIVARLTRAEPAHAAIILIEPTGTIAGTVVSEAGAPIEGAFVMPDARADITAVTTLPSPLTHGQTDALGRFVLHHIPMGNWILAVRAEGYAVLLSPPVPANSEDVVLTLSGGAGMAGRVLFAADNSPAAGVGVRVREIRSRYNAHLTVTDEVGRFAVARLADGEYGVNLDSETLIVIGSLPRVRITGGQPPPDLDIRVAEGSVVTGRAYDADTGAPLEDVEIELRGRAPTRTAHTGLDGVYRLTGLSPGVNIVGSRTYKGYRYAEAREDKRVELTLGEIVSGIDFPMRRGLAVRGRVVDADGRPLDLAHVRSQTLGTPVPEGESTVTGEDGLFAHRGFSADVTVQITAQCPGYAAGALEELGLGTEDLTGLEIVLHGGQRISGVVVDRQGRPVDRGMIVAQFAGGAPPGVTTLPAPGWSGVDGRFRIEGLHAGTYRLQGQHQRPGESSRGGMQDLGEVAVPHGRDVTGLRLVLDTSEGEVIAGRVLDSARRPIENARVNLYSEHALQVSDHGDAITDADGRFEVWGLAKTRFGMYIYKQGYTPTRRENVEAGTRNLEVVLEGTGAIEGRVIDAATGRPITDFEVGVVDALPGVPLHLIIETGLLRTLKLYVDPGGHYRLDEVAPGDVLVAARAKGLAPSLQAVSGIREGQTRTGVDFRLTSGGAIAGRVVNEQGRPVAHAQIYLGTAAVFPAGPGLRDTAAATDVEGRFRLESLLSHTYRISVRHEDYASASAEAAVAEGRTTELTIVLGQGGTVVGRVSLNGKPLEGARIFVLPQDGLPGRERYGKSGPRGDYDVSGIPPGSVYVQAGWEGGGRTMPQSAIIESGQTVVVDFDLSSGNAAIEGYVMIGGVPAAWGNVSASYEMPDTATVQTTVARLSEEGLYRIEGLPGNATVTVEARVGGGPGARPILRVVQVRTEEGRTVRQDIEIHGGTALTGSISNGPAGDNVAVIVVRGGVDEVGDDLPAFLARMRERMAGMATARLSSDGSAPFEVPSLEPGDYTVVMIGMTPPSEQFDPDRAATYPLTVGEGESPQLDVPAP